MRLNVEALVALTRGLLQAIVERRRGGVINVASQMAFQPTPYGVRVTAIALGFVTTEFARVAGSHAPERRFPHLEAKQVVAKALRAHEQRKSVKVVGGFYVILTLAGRFAPRAVLAGMMGRVLQPPASR